ncbi:GNAT family N-acetyltransferase [bacterium]|nr:GNAT family N-acetyltransferase [bacterium]
MNAFPDSIGIGDVNLQARFGMVKPSLTFESAKKLYDVVERNRTEFAKWFHWVNFVGAPEDEFAQLKSIADPTTCKYLLVRQDTGDIVGNVGVVEQSQINCMAEIGYWLDAGVRGQGLMTRAVQSIENLLFERHGVRRIQIRAAVENMPSRKVAQRLGYTEEGILRQAEQNAFGQFQDIVVYSKLKSEWEREKEI